jgi:hypothetical protein
MVGEAIERDHEQTFGELVGPPRARGLVEGR